MATEVKVPALGESITSGILAAWHVEDGAQVSEGDHLYDLETDKITSEGLAETSGVIRLKVAEGDEVEIGAVIAEIEESGGASGKEVGPEKKEVKEAEEEPVTKDAQGRRLSPAVQKAVAETGVDVSRVDGSGKDGRITKQDVLEAAESEPEEERKPEEEAKAEGEAGPSPTPEKEEPGLPSAKPERGERQRRRKLSPLRQRIAQRLVQAQQTAAILTTFNEVDMSAVMSLRAKYKEAFEKRHGVKLGFMSFFVKAVVQALQAVPSVNGQIEGENVVENHYYDIGVALSTPRGLLVPVVRDCEAKSFAEIEADILAYAQKGKEGKIAIADLEGGVFTITNGGIFGSMLSTPILNPPQSGILGMHTIKERPMVVGGEVVVRPMMYLALSYDHRLVDGREAVTFLVKVKEAIEDPARLALNV